MQPLIEIILATVFISIISFVGVLTVTKKEFLDKNLWLFVSFAAGAILSAVFFDLIPESYEIIGNFNFVLFGIIFFFIFEALIHWHHHHESHCEDCVEPIAFLNIAGDALHNLLDGVLIAASFIVNTGTGIATTLAVALHEVPQEIGDYAILVKAGLSKGKALFFNFISALFAIIGGILGFFFMTRIEGMLPYVIALAAGALLYIATTDILPGMHKERNYKKVIAQIIAFILGILVIYLIIGAFPE